MKNKFEIKYAESIPGSFLSVFMVTLFLVIAVTGCEQNDNTPVKHAIPKVITFDPDTSIYQEIFGSNKDSVVFYSSVVTVLPGDSGHIHNTEIYEEMIVTLLGRGEVKITNGKNLELKYGNIVFISPDKEHQVFNTGAENLKYIYIATKSIQN